MAAYSISVRSLLLIMALCLFGARTFAVPQITSPQTTIPDGGYRIAGIVVSKADAHPLGRARILLRDALDQRKFQSVVTSENGKFEFSGLPAGKYSLEGAKRGFISAGYEQHDQFSTAIVTGAGLDTETLALRLAPDAVITGKILDEVGEPLRHAIVTLYYVNHSGGLDQIHQFSNAQADDQGMYEITPLIPGTYFLSATGTPWYAVHPNSEGANSALGVHTAPTATVDRSLDVAYPVTYYPDVLEAESAMPIPVRGGDRVQVDVHINPVPALRLLFRVPGDANNGFTYPQLQQPAFDGSTSVQTTGGRMVSPGLVEITGIPAGRYNVRMNGGGSGLQMNGLDLSKDGEEIDTSSGEAPSNVKVSVQIPGETVLPSRLFVGLRSGRRVIAAWRPIDPKGEVQLDQITPGRYELLVAGGTKPYSIAHIASEGGEVSGHTLTVVAGSSPSLSLRLVGGSVEVQGMVKRAGKVFAGAMVVLVPKDPEIDHDLFRRDQSDLDGTFTLHGVIPGSYSLLAIENGWDLDWSKPGVIAAYRKQGRTIQVADQVGRPMKVAEPIEVQSK
jgi:hypothetical protein